MKKEKRTIWGVSWLLLSAAFSASSVWASQIPPAQSFQTQPSENLIYPLDVQTVHLYADPSSVAKADAAFANKHFKRMDKSGRIERVADVDQFKNRPVFKYVRGFVRINNGEKRKVRWRYRGLLDKHWKHPFPFKSIKINFDNREDGLGFDTINLNHVATDPMLYDMISHELYARHGVSPRMKLVRFYVNDEYAGFKVLVENVDDYFLKQFGLPIGNIYREDTAAHIGTKKDVGVNYYKLWWKKKALKKQKNWSDWIHFNQVFASGRKEAGDDLLDKDVWLDWLALSVWLPIQHYGDHNIHLYHNLENQKWYFLPWDPSVNPFSVESEDVLRLAPNKTFASLYLDPENYARKNQIVWDQLQSGVIAEELSEIGTRIYSEYIKEYEYCVQHLPACRSDVFESVDVRRVRELKDEISSVLKEKEAVLISYFQKDPDINVQLEGDSLVIKGVSLVSFKIKKNGWILSSYKNTPLSKDDKKEAVFDVEFEDILKSSGRPNWLTPKEFEIILKRPGRSAGFPQIASKFSTQYVTVKPGSAKVESETAAAPPTQNKKSSKIAQLYNKILGAELFSKFNNRDNVKVYVEQALLSLDQFEGRDYLPDHQVIEWSGEKHLKRTTIVPFNSTLRLDPGAIVKMDKGVSLIIQGALKSLGTKEEKVVFTSSARIPNKTNAWGSICFVQSLSQNSRMEHTLVEHGSEDFFNGVSCLGALSVYHVPFKLENSEFRHNYADDAANFLYSKAEITDNRFQDNHADAIDLDFSSATLKGNEFYNNGNDGVDCGTSIAHISSNVFFGQGDKGVSVGEESYVNIHNNHMTNNNIAVAMKDSSVGAIKNNVFVSNNYAVKSYIKKKKFSKAAYVLESNFVFNNKHDLVDENDPVEQSVYDTFKLIDSRDEINKIIEQKLLTQSQ